MNLMEVTWSDTVVCEGGPVIVAPAEVYSRWPGGRPLPLEARTALHIWGQFTAQLPERFRPAGPRGHQFLRGSSEELKALWNDIVEIVARRWPSAEWSMDEALFRQQVVRRDGKVLNFEFSPVSEYERSWQEAGDREAGEAWTHQWGADQALFWELDGPGVVAVGIPSDRRGLALLRTRADSEADGAEARAAALSGQGLTEVAALEVSSELVVAWAQADAAEVVKRSPELAAGVALNLEDIDGVGVVVGVEPGRYRLLVGSGESKSWAARWALLSPAE